MLAPAHLIKRLVVKVSRRYNQNTLHCQIDIVGRHGYGIENINLVAYSNQCSLKIGSFCSIAAKTTVLLGGDHRTDWSTTYPIGHIN